MMAAARSRDLCLRRHVVARSHFGEESKPQLFAVVELVYVLSSSAACTAGGLANARQCSCGIWLD